jgi:hypothetical protein
MEIEINKRVEQLLEQRMAGERERREKEIELEVQKRLAEAKRKLEKEMADELEKQKQIEFKRFLEKEVQLPREQIFCF